jgi:predicted alpha-1,2-mannosidase
VSFSPDTVNGNSSGYDSVSSVMGFSYTHVSGTGGASKYGNFRITPLCGKVAVNNLAFHRSNERAVPGRYDVILSENDACNVRVSLTATRRAGLARIEFPSNAEGSVVLDATSVIPYGGDKNEQYPTDVEVNILDKHHFSGYVTVAGGWNPAPYKLYFFGASDNGFLRSGTWSATQSQSQVESGRQHLSMKSLEKGEGLRVGLFATFDPQPTPTVQVKLAVSFVSIEQAKATLTTEMPGWDFDAIADQADRVWQQVLGLIHVEGGTEDQRRIFYSSLYRIHYMPHDLTGENVWWPSSEPHYEDFYTLWDTYRTVHPLFTLIEPARQRDMIRSLLDTYQHTGWLPDGRVAGANGLVQGGTSGDVLIADAIAKKLGGFDPRLAYEAVRKDAEVESPSPLLEGRELREYKALGYMSLNSERSGTRTLEYSYDDYAVAEVARSVGEMGDVRKFLSRSGNWKNLWDPALGCVRPRYANGGWLEHFDCDRPYPDHTAAWWDVPFYEGTSRQYSTFVPQDVEGLIAELGGVEKFSAWLDRLFDSHSYDPGNEPDLLAPYLYIYSGRHDRVCENVRQIVQQDYHPGRSGLPGNDDAGTISAWFVWSALGLYPDSGQPYYFIGSPIFTRSTIQLEGGRQFVIDALGTSKINFYVEAAELNGVPLSRAWLTHTEILSGGTLTLRMGSHPSRWASERILPPVLNSQQLQ